MQSLKIMPTLDFERIDLALSIHYLHLDLFYLVSFYLLDIMCGFLDFVLNSTLS